MTDATSQPQKTRHRGPTGRQRKIFREPLAPYVGCTCGQCWRCLDHAHWDRHFQKFVDPTYYDRGLVATMRSPLSDF